MAIVDTTLLVAYEEEDPAAIELWHVLRAQGEPMRVPAACWVEFLSAFSPAKRPAAARALQGHVTFEAFERPEADAAAKLQWDLRRAGRELAWHDLQVAATALRHDEVLVTNDARFQAVPGLRTLGH